MENLPAPISKIVVLWAVIDPIGTVPVFISATAGRTPAERRRIAFIATLTAAGIPLFFIVAGEPMLIAMGVLGDDVNVRFFEEVFNTEINDQVTVALGAEIAGGDSTNIGAGLLPGELIDIGNETITLNRLPAEPLSSYSFEDLDWVNALGVITGFTLQTDTGLVPGDIVFGSDFVVIPARGGFTEVTLDVLHVPEPTSIAI